eukprot:761390-Hanusia_phi.AAC.1
MPAPVQLLQRSSKLGLEPVPEGIKWLNEINLPVHVVAVVGTFHTGKSFLLNMLAHNRGSGFELGSTVVPTTEGVWAWGELLYWRDLKHPVLLLDVEGFGAPGNTRHYDSKLFSIIYVISSNLMYNSVKIIDQQEIEQLELLVRQALVFGNRVSMEIHKGAVTNSSSQPAMEEPTTPPQNQSVMVDRVRNVSNLPDPAFTWVVQDFFQDTVAGSFNDESAKEWLDRLLDSQPREQDSSRTLRMIFSSTDCQTMFIPTLQGRQELAYLDSPQVEMHKDYLEDLYSLKNAIVRSLSQREKSVPLLGFQVGSLLEHLTRVVESESFKSMPSVWSLFWTQYLAETCQGILVKAERPISISRLEERAIVLERTSLASFEKGLVGYNGHSTPHAQKLKDDLTKAVESTRARLHERISNHLKRESETFMKVLTNALQGISLPITSQQFKEQAYDTILLRFKQNWNGQCADYPTHSNLCDSIRKDAELKIIKLEESNREQIETVLEAASSQALKQYISCTTNGISVCLSTAEFAELDQRCLAHGQSVFRSHCSTFGSERGYGTFSRAAQFSMNTQAAELRKTNSECIRGLASKYTDEAIKCIHSIFSSEELPVGKSKMTAILETARQTCHEEFLKKLSNFSDHDVASEEVEKFSKEMERLNTNFVGENEESLKNHFKWRLDELAEQLEKIRPDFIIPCPPIQREAWTQLTGFCFEGKARILAKEKIGPVDEELKEYLEGAISKWYQSMTKESLWSYEHFIIPLVVALVTILLGLTRVDKTVALPEK